MDLAPAADTALDQMAQAMASCDDFVICGHVSPDGDCLGSQLALAWALRSLGKTVTCVLAKPDPVPPSLRFLPGAQDLVPAVAFRDRVRTFVAVDVSVRERLGDGARILDRCDTSFTIDHHSAQTPLCQYEHIDPDAPSASLLIWELAGYLADSPGAACALCAYTGLLTDTGGFRFQNATERAFLGAASMIAQGADAAYAATEALQSRTRASLALERIVLERMEVFAQGRAVISWLTAEDMVACQAVKSDTEPLVDVIRSLSGVRVACLLREQDSSVRGSLRAKDDTDVGSLARALGGGGHRAAAGFTLNRPMGKAVPLMQQRIEGLLACPVES